MAVGRLDKLALHPTVKPVQMIADAIKDVSPRGGLVSTSSAAEIGPCPAVLDHTGFPCSVTLVALLNELSWSVHTLRTLLSRDSAEVPR
jgi:hypothetical protein